MNELLLQQYQCLIESNNDEITILSNSSAFIMQYMEDISWAGFYLYKHNELILGPFQGKIACTNISLDKGVCGAAAREQKTQLVENVHEFPGHIACDSTSNSEIVVPIIKNGELYGVLDLDSTSFGRFKAEDQVFFEALVDILVAHL